MGRGARGAPIARRSLIRAIALGSTLLLLSPTVPLAIVRANHSPTHYLVTHVGTSFAATSSTKTFSGALKTVVESAVTDLNTAGGGTLTFESGVFDLGSSYFRLVEISNIVIEGQGIDVTIIKNFSTASADTEPFNTRGTYNVVIRDLTVTYGRSVTALRRVSLDVPAGSVAIANDQTVVYPYAISGGWSIIGRTPLTVFDAERQEPSMFAAGDRVRFKPISRAEFLKQAK